MVLQDSFPGSRLASLCSRPGYGLSLSVGDIDGLLAIMPQRVFFERSPDVVLIRRSVTRVRHKPCEAEAEYFEGPMNT
jgi:hypothetical protein